MSELVLIEQVEGRRDAAPWILDRHGRRMLGRDDARRMAELRAGLVRHERVRACPLDAPPAELDRIVGLLHEPHYIEALRAVHCVEPELMPRWAPPGLPADSPVWADVVASAFEGMRTAIAAARRLVDGARFAYALSRPPGHHAGPAWMGGYCYLNTAAAAAQALSDGGLGPLAIVDLDFHFPTGTSAVAGRMKDVILVSLHACTLENVPWRVVSEKAHERFVDFATPPDAGEYLGALERSLQELRSQATALVISLGYDTVAGDPHGTWGFSPDVFAGIGRALAACELPVCVVQEGGYALDRLAECSHAFARGLLEETVR